MSGVPGAVVSFLLQNFKEFVVTNAQLIGGAKDDVDQLKEELEKLRVFVKRCAEQRYSEDEFLALLAKNVRKLAYKVEDAIENYILAVSKHKFESSFRKYLKFNHAKELRKIGKQLNAHKRKVDRFRNNEMGEGLKLMKMADMSMTMDKGPTNEGNFEKRTIDESMVGFKDTMKEVMRYLMDGPDDLQTVSIVGKHGLGKTTLARQIFKHPTVECRFSIRAFVEVSEEFKKREVLLKLVCALAFGNVCAEYINWIDEDLEDAVKKFLDKRNYFIVLDDVWTCNAWNQLNNCFPKNQKHSRVLITTRNQNISHDVPHALRCLDECESKELLRKRVFGQTNEIRPDLEVYETAILARCGGLPLAIVLVAGILTIHQEESNWWEDVSKKVGKYNLGNKVGDAVKMSFNHLPYHLRPCFLYLGVFREDFEISSRTLYQLWISEGFVPQGDIEETLEDMAEDYLEQLVDRSLVMGVKRRSNGRIRTIQIHDVLRDFCKKQAVEEELFREIKSEKEACEMSPDNDRRLCINFTVGEFITKRKKQEGKVVRSFLSFSKDNYMLPLECISKIPKAFKLLRVLNIRTIRFTDFPDQLLNAFLLKYIAMYSDAATIPQGVSNLKYLQTLIVNTNQRRIEIKADTWKMSMLRHLETNASTSLEETKDDVFFNDNLQTLSLISPKSCTPDVFVRARKLKKLGICGELVPYMENLFVSLSEHECLEDLKLWNDSSLPLKSLPNHDNFPPKLTRLTLQNTMLSWEWMSTLAKLKNLEVLKLKHDAFIGEFWNTEGRGGFSALKVLHIENAGLSTWKTAKCHFPKLESLYLRHCTKLRKIPYDLVNITTLQQIDIYCCKAEVANSARKLVIAKLQLQAQENNGKINQLKLIIYPLEN